MDQDVKPTSEHVDETVEQLGRMYDEHRRNTSRTQRLANLITARLGKPAALIFVVLLMLVWVVGNYAARLNGWTPLEQFPYSGLEFVATVMALLVALLILTTQRHQDELAEKRSRLTLQIAALSEKKVAKVIELLEEQRRDNPMLPTRKDHAAQEMAVPVEPDSDLIER